MKRSVAVEPEETDGSTETGSLLEKTLTSRMSDPKTETSSSVSVTSEEVACQIKAATDPLTQPLANLCELMQELKNEKANRRHEETASSRIAGTFAGSNSWSDIKSYDL